MKFRLSNLLVMALALIVSAADRLKYSFHRDRQFEPQACFLRFRHRSHSASRRAGEQEAADQSRITP
jgi:hypothetical protein